jgi:hypothetical protein
MVGMKAHKRFKTLCFILPISLVFIFIGFPMINAPIKVTFDMYPDEEAQEYFGERFASITAGAGKSIKLPTPMRARKEMPDGRVLPEYVFKGWSKDKNGSSMVGTTANTSMKLYAIWAPFEPTAQLYVDGFYLREALIPTPDAQGATAGSTWGSLGTAFKPRTEWMPSILEAYDMDEFFGWWYSDSNGRRRELRWDIDNRWYHYVQSGTTFAPRVAVNTDNPFFPRHDIALNAMFGVRHASTSGASGPKNTGKSVTVKFMQMGKGEIAKRTYKYGEAQTLEGRLNVDIPLGGAALGWKIDIDGEITGTDKMGDIFNFGSQFYFSPLLFERNRFEITFYAATVTSNTLYTGTWNKVLATDGKVRLDKSAESASTTINEFPAYNAHVAFDFAGGRTDIRDITTVTQEQLAAGQKFPDAETPKLADSRQPKRITTNVSVTAYDTGRINLLSPLDFAVAGHKFGGWKCVSNDAGTNGRIFGASYDFIIPRGLVGELKFVATWVKV